MKISDILVKMSQNIFSYFSISEHSASFFFQKKTPILVTTRGFAPPPFTDWSKLFFSRSPLADIGMTMTIHPFLYIPDPLMVLSAKIVSFFLLPKVVVRYPSSHAPWGFCLGRSRGSSYTIQVHLRFSSTFLGKT